MLDFYSAVQDPIRGVYCQHCGRQNADHCGGCNACDAVGILCQDCFKAEQVQHAPATEKNCRTCVHPVSNPYRRIVNGTIVEGCVDDDHTGHLPEGTNTYGWHMQGQAVSIRAAWKAFIKG